jgi:nitrogenase molybdenum-iron protein beta chain
VVVHSVTGCLYGAVRPHIQSRLNDMRQLSSVVYETESVMGGGKKLGEAMRYALDNFKPSVLFVLSGCIPEIIGDDIVAAAEDVASAVPVIPLRVPGFKDDYETGMLRAVEKLTDYMAPSETIPNSVNLIGICSDDFHIDADMPVLKALLGPDLHLNAVLCYDTFDKIRNAPRAACNIVFPGFKTIGELMLQKFGIPFKVVGYPYGMAATSDFVRTVHEPFGIECGEINKKNEDALLQKLSPVSNYIGNLGQVPCAVVGNRLFGGAMTKVLSSELGMSAVFYDTGEYRDFREIERKIEASPAAIIFGDSFSRGIADRLHIPHISCFYPVLDRIACSPGTYAGYEGLTYLIEDVVNAAMNFR